MFGYSCIIYSTIAPLDMPCKQIVIVAYMIQSWVKLIIILPPLISFIEFLNTTNVCSSSESMYIVPSVLSFCCQIVKGNQ